MPINERLKEFRHLFFCGITIIFLFSVLEMSASALPNVEIGCGKKSCLSDDGITLQGTKVIPGTAGSVSVGRRGSPPAAGPKPKPKPKPEVVSTEPERIPDILHSPFTELPPLRCPDPPGAYENGLRGITPCPPKKPTPPPQPKPTVTPPTPPQLIEVIKKLPLDKPVLKIEPHTEALVNVDEIAYTTTPQHHTFHTTLLGQPVTITTHITQYRWKWGDGTTTTSQDGGHPYPDQTVTYPYPKPGNYTIQLTTVITATYTNPDGITRDIPGTTTLTSNPQHLKVKQQHTVLVSPREGF